MGVMKLIVHAMKIKSGRVVTPLASACLKDVTGKKIAQVVMMKKAEPGSDPLAKVAAMPITVPTDTISKMSPCVASSLNTFTSELRRLFLVENMVDTIKFGLSLWLLTYLGSWFNFLTLVILAWLGLFTAPKLYINNQAQVDEVVGKVMAQVDEVKGKVLAMIPNKAPAKEE